MGGIKREENKDIIERLRGGEREREYEKVRWA